MAAPKVTKTKVSQKINLLDEFGLDFRGEPALREAIGQVILDRITTRTDSGKGMRFDSKGRGTPVTLKSPYSKAYSKSLPFRAAGKSKSKINMKLTGDMMGFMDVTKSRGNNIEIGWNGSDDQDSKAFNHITGDTVPSRPFFGISKSELKTIKSDMKSELKEAMKIKAQEGETSFNEFVVGLARGNRDG